MAKYMDQLLFNTLVYTLAWADDINEVVSENTDQIISDMLFQYRKSYPEDDFEIEIASSLKFLNSWLLESFDSKEAVSAWLNAFRQASVDWLPNGRRRGRFIFNGTFFTSLRVKPLTRVDDFARDTALYFANICSGNIHGN
jgi:hypothetical protein